MKKEPPFRDLSELLSKKFTLHQLDDCVPVELQKRYTHSMTEFLSSRQGRSFEFSSQELQNIEKELYSSESTETIQERLLQELAICRQVEAHRIIEDFSAVAQGNLLLWTKMSLLQSKVALLSFLTDEQQIVISSGLGGRDGSIRYMACLISEEEYPFLPYQSDLVVNELSFLLSRQGGHLEAHSLNGSFILVTFLLPLGNDPEKIFMDLLQECNKYGNFLSSRLLITNTHVLTPDMIREQMNE